MYFFVEPLILPFSSVGFVLLSFRSVGFVLLSSDLLALYFNFHHCMKWSVRNLLFSVLLLEANLCSIKTFP